MPSSRFAPGFDGGLGLRLWLATYASLRVDILELVYVVDSDVSQALHLHAGIAFNFGGKP